MIQMDTNISASRLQGEQLVRGMDGYAGTLLKHRPHSDA